MAALKLVVLQPDAVALKLLDLATKDSDPSAAHLLMAQEDFPACIAVDCEEMEVMAYGFLRLVPCRQTETDPPQAVMVPLSLVLGVYESNQAIPRRSMGFLKA